MAQKTRGSKGGGDSVGNIHNGPSCGFSVVLYLLFLYRYCLSMCPSNGQKAEITKVLKKESSRRHIYLSCAAFPDPKRNSDAKRFRQDISDAIEQAGKKKKNMDGHA